MDDLETANLAESDDTSLDTGTQDDGAENENQELDTELEDGSQEDGQAEPDEEFEEIERDGKKAKIPTWLKAELLMQADYTRKTQELAEVRKALEAEREIVSKATAEEITARSNLTLIDRQLAAYAKTDWNALTVADPVDAQQKFQHFTLLKDAKAQTQTYLGQLQTQRTEAERQEAAKRLQAGAAELARDIKDWSPETAAKLLDFGTKRFGFSKDELDEVDDPRLVKVLHAAFQWEQHQTKQKRAQSHVAAQTAKPAATVGRSAPPPRGLDDRLSVEEWNRRREEQLRKRG